MAKLVRRELRKEMSNGMDKNVARIWAEALGVVINDKTFSSEEFKCERQEIYRVAIEVQNLKDDVKMKFADLDSDKKIDFKYYI